jgi:hypothetical protein
MEDKKPKVIFKPHRVKYQTPLTVPDRNNKVVDNRDKGPCDKNHSKISGA